MSQAINRITLKKHYALPSFEWLDIPSLAVISGINGSGKTLLLQAIYDTIQQNRPLNNMELELEPLPNKDECGYVPWQQSSNRPPEISYAASENERDRYVSKLSSAQRGERITIQSDPIHDILDRKFGDSLYGNFPKFYSSPEFRNEFDSAWAYSQDVTHNHHISRLFLNYNARRHALMEQVFDEKHDDAITRDEIIERIGEAPWNLINHLFERYDFKYRINRPIGLYNAFDIKFTAVDNDQISVPFNALSSGEQMIVNLILWSFDSKLGQLKRILLLDEPDAHLHPEMAEIFQEIVCDTLVDKYSIQVIITTHSPTTLCWFNEDSIFLMDPVQGPVKREKQTALAKMTSDLLIVQETTRVVLVEDEADQLFYRKIYRELVHAGRISSQVPLDFRPVSKKRGVGGKGEVLKVCEQWIGYTEQMPISGLLWGLVDLDANDIKNLPKNVITLSRYCMENYLADPLLMFTYLVEVIKHKDIEKFAIQHDYITGDTLKFKRKEIDNPQTIVNCIYENIVANDNCDLEKSDLESLEPCHYINGIKIQLPKKVLQNSGKNFVFELYRNAFGITTPGYDLLTDYMVKTHLIPVELLDKYKELASHHQMGQEAEA